MGHAAITLSPGVNVTETPTLNQAGISVCQLIRFQPDPVYGALTQKLGGWQKFYSQPMVTTVRALWPWEDTNGIAHLAFGTQTVPGTTSAQLGAITNGVLQDISPQQAMDNIAPSLNTTSGSATVLIDDTTIPGITQYDSVFIPTQISVGGIIIFGQYQCDFDAYIAPTQYSIQSVDVLGTPNPATSTVSTGGVLPVFSTTSGQISVSVQLPNHGQTKGSTFPVLISTSVGGITLYGNYVVQSVTDANNFVIFAAPAATSTASVTLNGGNAQYIYSLGFGSLGGGTGYGVGAYGSGGYGSGTTITPATATAIPAKSWSLDNWGEILIANPTQDSNGVPYAPIYGWSPTTGQVTASVIPAAPTYSTGVFVAMPQRQIISYGSTFNGVPDPLLVRWCDVSNFNSWIGTVINQAGSYRLTTGSRIVGAIQGPQQGLIWTDIGLWAMQYVSQPYVYSFNEIGKGCGLIAQRAAAAYNGAVYWMGPAQFYVLAGSGVQPVTCPVWDVVYQQLDQQRLNLIRVAVNSKFGEITWYYPSPGSLDASNYVKYNALLNVWDYGVLTRTAWADQSVLGPPLGAGLDTNTSVPYIYQHDGIDPATGYPSTNDDVYPMISNFQTGYAAMDEADMKTFVDQVWPDMKWNYFGNTATSASVQITFKFTDYPNQTPQTIGPYTLTSSTQYISPRFRGRLVSVSIGSQDMGSFWRLGKIRYRAVPDGKF